VPFTNSWKAALIKSFKSLHKIINPNSPKAKIMLAHSIKLLKNISQIKNLLKVLFKSII
jgi:hypothetical protein